MRLVENDGVLGVSQRLDDYNKFSASLEEVKVHNRTVQDHASRPEQSYLHIEAEEDEDEGGQQVIGNL